MGRKRLAVQNTVY